MRKPKMVAGQPILDGFTDPRFGESHPCQSVLLEAGVDVKERNGSKLHRKEILVVARSPKSYSCRFSRFIS